MSSPHSFEQAFTLPPLGPHELVLPLILEEIRTYFSIGLLFLLPFIFNYVFAWATYHWQHHKGGDNQLPPEYPSFIPYFGGAWSLLLKPQAYLNSVTSYAGKLTSARVNVLGKECYFIQDRESVRAMWKQVMLGSPMAPYVLCLKHLFGMENRALSTYEADTSGPFHKPFPGSDVEPHNRVDQITHHTLLKGLTGPGLKLMQERTVESMRQRLEQLPVADDWVEYGDMLKFFQDIVGASIIESMVGPSLLKVNPSFLEDYWVFDYYVSWFARGIPRFLIPKGFAIRTSLLDQLKNWYIHARSNFTSSSIAEDGDYDPYWGSTMMRTRQETLKKIDNHDDSAHASTDLGLIWASVSNVVPASMFAVMHIFKEHDLLTRVRRSVDHMGSLPGNAKEIVKTPILESIYLETLRLYVKSYFLTTSPLADINLPKWHIPKGKMIFVNSGISHMDRDFWNTKNGLWPLETFWADRFIMDPKDASSGPILPAIAQEVKTSKRDVVKSDTMPYVSTEGLEGSWIPYGGGHAMCPGRFLAKNTIIIASMLVATMFELEVLSGPIEMSSAKFGLGAFRPKNKIPFRLRKRQL